MAAEAPRAWVTVPSGVSVRAFPDQAVVLNADSGRYYGLDQAGTAFWEAIRDHATRAEAIAALDTIFETDRATIAADLDRFCGQLEERGLIERHGG